MIYREGDLFRKKFNPPQILISILSNQYMDINLAIFNLQMDLKILLINKILMIANKILKYFKISISSKNLLNQFLNKISSDNQMT